MVKQSKWKNARIVKTLGALNIDKNKKNNSDKNAKLVYKYLFNSYFLFVWDRI